LLNFGESVSRKEEIKVKNNNICLMGRDNSRKIGKRVIIFITYDMGNNQEHIFEV
jgi:hypothetical protein